MIERGDYTKWFTASLFFLFLDQTAVMPHIRSLLCPGSQRLRNQRPKQIIVVNRGRRTRYLARPLPSAIALPVCM